jgi:Asp-tRNA(Asn)/Glu-tRNA(Gln) amidotransferase B subunit
VALAGGWDAVEQHGREVLAEMVATGAAPRRGGGAEGAAPDQRHDELERIVEEVIAAHPSKVEEYRSGRPSLLGFFMGQLMKRTGGKANPELAKELLQSKLGGGDAAS